MLFLQGGSVTTTLLRNTESRSVLKSMWAGTYSTNKSVVQSYPSHLLIQIEWELPIVHGMLCHLLKPM